MTNFKRRSPHSYHIRHDLHQWLREECLRLNCSQGVFVELMIERAMDTPFKDEDVFQYSAEMRWLEQRIADLDSDLPGSSS